MTSLFFRPSPTIYLYSSVMEFWTPPTDQASCLDRGGASPEQLHCEQVHLGQLAERFGTPLYVYSSQTIRKRVEAFNKAFNGVRHSICYSVKANSNISILRLLSRLGCGFDVVSGGELERVLRADRRAAKKVVFSGVGKKAEEIESALKAGNLLF